MTAAPKEKGLEVAGPMKLAGQMGRPSLAPEMSLTDYVSLGLGTMIGIAWVIYMGVWLSRGGPMGAILGFVIGGLLLIPIGKCYAELASSLPLSGGAIAFAYKAFGTKVSFLAGWVLVLCYVMVSPYMLVAISWVVEYMFPQIKTPALYTIGGQAVSLSSIIPGLVAGITISILNYLGVKGTARFQTACTVLLLGCVVVGVSVSLLKGHWSNLLPLFVSGSGGSFWRVPASILGVLAIVPFFMGGFDAIAQAAEESGCGMKPKDLGTAVMVAIILGFVFYAAVIFSVSFSYPWQQTVTFELPTAHVFKAAFGYEWVKQLILYAALLGLITTLNGVFLAGTRVLFAKSRGGLLPGWLGQVDSRYHSPKNAVLFMGLFTLVGPFVGKSLLLPVANVGALAFISACFITCLSAIQLRKIAPQMSRPYRVKHAATLYVAAITAAAIMLSLLVPGSPSQISWPVEYCLVAVWMVLGYGLFVWRKRRRDLGEEDRAFLLLGPFR